MDKKSMDFKEQAMDAGIQKWATEFDAWLESEEGKAWLLSYAEMEAERRGTTDWQGGNW